MKTKLQKLTAFFLIGVTICLCSCSKKSPDTYAQITGAREKFSSSLSAVRVYSSEASEGADGYADRTLVAALLGEGGEFPAELDLCESYAFFCASSLDICEAWAVECRTYSSARDIEALFERRRAYLLKQDFDLESDIEAVSGARVVRVGRRVYFAAAPFSEKLLEYLTESS